MWKKIIALPGEEQWGSCSFISTNSDVLSNLLLNSMKSLGVHEVILQNPHQILILFNKNSSERPKYLQYPCCLNYTPGFLVFKVSSYILMGSLKSDQYNCIYALSCYEMCQI